MRVFENRVLRRIFGPKRDGVTGEWRKLHNEELNDLYSSPNIVRVIKSRLVCWYLHLVVIEELQYPNNPESYAVCSVATGRVTLGGQVEE